MKINVSLTFFFILALVVTGKKLSLNKLCNLPKEKGDCRAIIDRLYYNTETGKCEYFMYGGCGGNQNNFKTIKECQKACMEDHNNEKPGR